jgi:hypothetical protein
MVHVAAAPKCVPSLPSRRRVRLCSALAPPSLPRAVRLPRLRLLSPMRAPPRRTCDGAYAARRLRERAEVANQHGRSSGPAHVERHCAQRQHQPQGSTRQQHHGGGRRRGGVRRAEALAARTGRPPAPCICLCARGVPWQTSAPRPTFPRVPTTHAHRALEVSLT